MLKSIFIIILFFSIHSSAFAQIYRNHYTENGVGLIDSLGNIIVEDKYQQIDYQYDYSFYKVQQGDKYGVIDSVGNLIIEPKYDDIGSYGEGLYIASLNSKLGYLNAKGKVVIPFKYLDAKAFHNGFACVAVKDKYERISYGIITKKGKTIVPFIYDFIYNFNEGLAIVRSNETRFDKYGAVNEKGRIIIPIKYSDLKAMQDGRLIAKLNDLTGVIDKNNNVIVDFKYTFISDFKDGMARVYDKSIKRYGYIDTLGNEIPLIYTEATDFSEGYAAVRMGSYWAYINKEGKAITAFKYKSEPAPFYNGRGSVFTFKRIYIYPDGSESDY